MAAVLPTEPDLLIYAVGYEQRSAKMRDELSAKKNAAFVYRSEGVHSYDGNYRKFTQRGDIGLDTNCIDLEANLTHILRPGGANRAHVVIDVSCLNRSLIAQSFSTLLRLSELVGRITVTYTPGKFVPPTLYMMPAQYFGPAIPSMAANVGEPYRESCLVMGLGYEYGAALSAIEVIEPNSAFYFYPVGRAKDYEPAVRKANFNFDFGVGKYQVLPYNIEDPVSLHGVLRDIVDAFVDKATVSIVPFGPKIFSSVAVLMAIRHPRKVSFLRYSLASAEVARDTEADDYMSLYDILLAGE
ncbi:hypothetical protein [Mesorhizobium sp. WSM3862]|uniref:hypothetical protein n=1 Tax=Mesorhizobium sp. WSM3862 TaxID=632858 RepID=UPI001AECD21E|nr:hypothetical protein [Mesorhizobium sp. WSM3862]